MLEFRSILKTYPGRTTAVDRVSLDVPRGQFCVLLGASGAGKSTLLRVVNGLTALDSGTVAVDGVEISKRTLRSVRRRVGMVHQQFNLVPRLSVLDNVLAGTLPVVNTWRAATRCFPPELHRKACRLLAEVGLTEAHLTRRSGQLSGGQQQRVAVARALVLDPVVLLADEPVASLDPQTSAAIMQLLRDSSRARGTTVLCSLHQVDLALRFADRIVAMRKGRVIFDREPATLDPARLNEIYLAEGGSASADVDDVIPQRTSIASAEMALS